MNTVIIGIGLDNRFLSPDVAYLALQDNVGRLEINRLMGDGKELGSGPLSAFLLQAAATRREGGAVGTILITRAEGSRGAAGHPDGGAGRAADTDLIEPLMEIAGEAEVVVVHDHAALGRHLSDAIERVAGVSPANGDLPDTRFLVVGCHTENRVLAVASFLRNVLGMSRVAVSSHLSGSASVEAHFAALRHNLPSCGVRVFLDLEATADYAGLPGAALARFGCRPCAIGPAEACEQIDVDQRRIVENLCMHWTRTRLRPLQGGFSGSLLFLADGWKGDARTEPVVLKIDRFPQMRREINGYHQVKDFFGKSVPTFSHPVSLGESVGVSMEFAAMDGRPETLQDTFEEAEHEENFQAFMLRLDRSLLLLAEKLYRNTSRKAWVVPYRVFGLHADQQVRWLHDNMGCVMEYAEAERVSADVLPLSDAIERMVKVIAANENGLESEVCLAHGDLNYQNIICDQADNIWFIDWTHSGEYPIEMDFAKLENDVKFVMSKQFDLDDLPRLKRFEEYLLSQRLPAEPGSLPDHLKYVKWDLRFRKMLEVVRKIREVCFSVKDTEDWLVYQVALLKFAMHTLSFDKRRDRGECELSQLLHTLYSVDALAFNLVSDDFHLRIRGERPSTYPPRQNLAIDMAPWAVDCSEYDPPYYVAPSVIDADMQKTAGGWADPEEFSELQGDVSKGSSGHSDRERRPLNPRGRTGLAGRGLLGRWGANPAAAAVVIRCSQDGERLDLLAGKRDSGSALWLPRGFLRPGEDPDRGIERIVTRETGWNPSKTRRDQVFEGYIYDPRQTDHAWVEIRTFLFSLDFDKAPRCFEPGRSFEEVGWMHLDPGTVNTLRSNEARFVREAVRHLRETATIRDATATRLLLRTG